VSSPNPKPLILTPPFTPRKPLGKFRRVNPFKPPEKKTPVPKGNPNSKIKIHSKGNGILKPLNKY